MADVARPPKDNAGIPQLPRTVSALRSSRSGPKRVPTRVSIVVPQRSAKNNPSSSTGPATSSDSTATSSSAHRSPDLSVSSTPWTKKLILTLDGGGIRGYSSLIILRALMREIAAIEQDLEPHATSSAHTDRIPANVIPDKVFRRGQYLPCHYFDYIAGTSYGGLIAILLGMSGKSADECITEFCQNKAIPLTNHLPGITINIPLLPRRSTWPTKRTRAFFDTFAKFSVTSTAQPASMPSAHRESNATSTTVPPTASSSLSNISSVSTTAEFKKDTFQCQTLAWCTEVEDRPHSRSRRKPYAFCSYKEEDIDEDDEPNDTIQNPARARAHTSATTTTTSSSSSMVSIPEVATAILAPSSWSFKPFKLGGGQFVDGSNQVRDPTLEVLKEIYNLLLPSDDDDDDEIISPTTTTTSKKKHDPPIDLLLSLGTDEHHAWFYEKLRRPVLERNQAAWKAQIHSQEGRSYREYHRFEVKGVKLGMRKKYFLGQVQEVTESYLADNEEVRGEIRRYAEFLVERRRARASTSRWETFALGVKYFCHHHDNKGKSCNVRAEVGFESRGDFYGHLEKKHDLLRRTGRNEVDIEAELDKGRRFGCR